MTSIFSRIVKGDLDCYKIFEDHDHLAFLDAFPLELGHVLVIPKKQVDNIFDLDLDEYLSLWQVSKNIAQAMQEVISCERIAISVVGLEVPHAHIHLVPINQINDINFEKDRKHFSDKEMVEISDSIRKVLE